MWDGNWLGMWMSPWCPPPTPPPEKKTTWMAQVSEARRFSHCSFLWWGDGSGVLLGYFAQPILPSIQLMLNTYALVNGCL